MDSGIFFCFRDSLCRYCTVSWTWRLGPSLFASGGPIGTARISPREVQLRACPLDFTRCSLCPGCTMADVATESPWAPLQESWSKKRMDKTFFLFQNPYMIREPTWIQTYARLLHKRTAIAMMTVPIWIQSNIIVHKNRCLLADKLTKTTSCSLLEKPPDAQLLKNFLEWFLT
jgi:hypothetical protein